MLSFLTLSSHLTSPSPPSICKPCKGPCSSLRQVSLTHFSEQILCVCLSSLSTPFLLKIYQETHFYHKKHSNYLNTKSMESPRKSHTQISIKPSSQELQIPDDEAAIDELAQEQKMPFFKSISTNRESTWIISLFVLLHIVVFASTMLENDCWIKSHGDCAFGFLGRLSFQRLRENPFLGPSVSTLDRMGALRQKFLTTDHQFWRLLTSLWLHAGALHLAINICSILFVGLQLEQKFGSLRIGIIYMMSAFTGSSVAALFVRNSPAACSSGALFGLIGASLSALIRSWDLYTDKVVALTALLVISVVNLVLGFLPYVDNFSNIGGAISGFLLGFLLFFPPQIRKAELHKGLFDYGTKRTVAFKHLLDKPILRSISLVLLSLVLAGVLVPVLHGINVSKYCSWCQYIDCVPSRKWTCDIKPTSCQRTVSGGRSTLTCMESDNFRVFPYTGMSHARMEELCNLICS